MFASQTRLTVSLAVAVVACSHRPADPAPPMTSESTDHAASDVASPEPPDANAERDPGPTNDERLCSQRFDRAQRCRDTVGRPIHTRPAFVELCRERMNKDRADGTLDDALIDAELACWERPCREIMPCMRPTLLEQLERGDSMAVQDALASGSEYLVVEACASPPDDARTACRDRLAALYEARRDRAETELAEGTSAAQICRRLFEPVNLLSDDALLRQTYETCARLDAADAIASAKRAQERGARLLPAACHTSLRRLQGYVDPWAQTLRRKVVNACAGQLAADIVRREADVPDAECDADLRMAIYLVQEHEITSNGIGQLATQALKRCGPLGIPECDRYIIDYRQCIATKIPKARRETSRLALQTTIDAWRESAETEIGRDGLEGGCTRAREALASACGW